MIDGENENGETASGVCTRLTVMLTRPENARPRLRPKFWPKGQGQGQGLTLLESDDDCAEEMSLEDDSNDTAMHIETRGLALRRVQTHVDLDI